MLPTPEFRNLHPSQAIYVCWAPGLLSDEDPIIKTEPQKDDFEWHAVEVELTELLIKNTTVSF